MEKGKVCTKCKQWKHLGEFYSSAKGKLGKDQSCKECKNKINKAWRDKQRQKGKKCTVEGCENYVYVKGFCNAHYLRNKRNGSPHIKKSPGKMKLEFVVTNVGCFEVISHKTGNHGYPQVRHKGVSCPAHRRIYEVCFGEIEKGLVVRHKCDNRLCVNPEHLELGTIQDNMKDMFKRKENAYGERNGCSKLTEQEVKEIKGKFSGVKTTVKEINKVADKYNVKQSTIYDVIKGRTWKHMEVWK